VFDRASSNDMWRENQLDATQWFIELIIRSICFRHYYAHHQELETMQRLQRVAQKHFVCGRLWSGLEL